MPRLKPGAKVTITDPNEARPTLLGRKFILGETVGTVIRQVRPSTVSGGRGYEVYVEWEGLGHNGATAVKRHEERILTPIT